MIREYINTVMGIVVAAIVVIAVAIPIISDIGQDTGTDITNPETDLHYTLNQDHTLKTGNPLYIDDEPAPDPGDDPMAELILLSYEGYWTWDGGTVIGFKKYPNTNGTAASEGKTVTITDGEISGVDLNARFTSADIFVKAVTGGDWGGYQNATIQVPEGEPVYIQYTSENTNNHYRGLIKVIDGNVVEGHVYRPSTQEDVTPESIDCTVEDGIVTYPPKSVEGYYLLVIAQTSYVAESENDTTMELVGLVPVIMISGLMIACVTMFLRNTGS